MVQEASGHLLDLSKLSKTQRTAIAKRLLVANDADNAQTKLMPATAKGLDGAAAGAAAAAASLATTAAAQAAGGEGGEGAGAKRSLFSAVSDLARLSAAINGSGSGAFGGEQAMDAAVAGVALGRSGKTASSCKKVWRHLRTGDALLVNRQPTLHKPGIMAHKARVLMGEKVIRMHYANCNTYNADFDGDEMNVHMCQNELARAEAYGIAATDHQYIVPTNGKPLRGLIQDHIVMGVLLTKRDTFLSRSEVMQLLHLAHMDLSGLKRHGRVAPLPVPALLKPQVRWTGKQVISHLLLHLHPHARHLSMEAGTKTPASAWSAAKGRGKPEPEDATVIVRRGELLQGVLDKAAFGASEFGLVHCVHELLGGEATGRLLTQLGKLFTGFNQMVGFTCGIADLLLSPEADEARLALHMKADDLGLAGVRAFVGAEALDAGIPRAVLNRKVGERLRLAGGEKEGAKLDGQVKQKLMPLTSEAVAACLPSGQYKPFPANQFALMTSTGAKGGPVNFSQIAVMLGQQELEGRRVPLSPSGCTAPCFAPYELSARAGGYITDRFLTGVRPPDFYFHCMAGREGLVDTAVKTSRSGYLQRCLIKHLEPLQVAYDHTVRATAAADDLRCMHLLTTAGSDLRCMHLLTTARSARRRPSAACMCSPRRFVPAGALHSRRLRSPVHRRRRRPRPDPHQVPREAWLLRDERRRAPSVLEAPIACANELLRR
jgi:DNA-directed RNA polymerase I subunit RPA1